MSLTDLCRVPATIIHQSQSTPDARGDRYPVEVARTEILAYVEQTSTSEDVGDRTHVGSTHRIVFPVDVARLGPHDLVEVNGAAFAVVGEPVRPLHPASGGGPHHVEVSARLDRG